MINISNLSEEMISKLSGAYMHATMVFGIEPMNAPTKKLRKIRKWLSKQYKQLICDLENATNEFSSDKDNMHFVLWLSECYKASKRSDEVKQAKQEIALARLDKSVRAAIDLLGDICLPDMKMVDGDLELVITETLAYRQVLVLKDVKGVPEDNQWGWCDYLWLELTDEDRICMYGELENPYDDTVVSLKLTFSDAKVKAEVYNACAFEFSSDDPWEILKKICLSINSKYEFLNDLCNEKEKKLLPLMQEVEKFNYLIYLGKQDDLSFENLKSLARKYELSKLENLLLKLETVKVFDKRSRSLARKIASFLCKPQSMPLWRDIRDKLIDSQSEYPKIVKMRCDEALLKGVRDDIQKLMHSKGYVGTYPDFEKDGELKGVHLEKSYGMSYFVAGEKRVKYRVHCNEYININDDLVIQFLCGTAFLKRGEEINDVYDCAFDFKGRHLFHTVKHGISLKNGEKYQEDQDDLPTSVSIAVKKTECIKLDKNEKKQYYKNKLPGWFLFWCVFIIGGSLFGIVMTFASIIICSLCTILLGMFSDLPEMFLSIPWWLIFLIGWVGFGGSMGIVEVLAQSK